MILSGNQDYLPAYEPPPITSGQGQKPVAPAISQELQDLWAGSLHKDQKLRIEINGSDSIVLQGTNDKSWIDDAKNFAKKAVDQIRIGAQSGPCLALTVAGEAIKPLACLGLSDEQTSAVNSVYTPAVRGLCMVVSGIEMVESWKHHQKSLDKADLIDMGISGLHVLTSAAGLAGAVARTLSPSLQQLGTIGLGLAVAGDLITFGRNRMQYSGPPTE